MAIDDQVLDALRRHMVAVFETFELDAAQAHEHLSALMAEGVGSPAPVVIEPLIEPEAVVEPVVEPVVEALEPISHAERDSDEDISSLVDELEGELDLEELPELEELPPDPVEPEPPIRRHPRYELNEAVEITLADRGELKELWVRDISKGGLFLATSEPPLMDAELRVTLKTPDGQIVLNAKVVHVVDAAQAAVSGMPAGAGLEFADLDKSARDALEAYVAGVASSLSRDSAAPLLAAEEADDARMFLEAVQHQDIYLAINVPPTSTVEVILARVEELEARFGASTEDSKEQTRLMTAMRALQRFRKEVFSSAARWLAYDFMNGHVRAEERLASGDARTLREVWCRVFPERSQNAASLWGRAKELAQSGSFDHAVAEVERAIELDPFHTHLRAAHASWVQTAEAAEKMRTETPDLVSTWAETSGVARTDLRSVWMQVHPTRVEAARQHAERALQAIEMKLVDEAIEAGVSALALDPFNDELASAIQEWQAGA